MSLQMAGFRLTIAADHCVVSINDAPVAELADALDLGSSALWRESSSLSGRTNLYGGSGGGQAILRDSRVLNSSICIQKVSVVRCRDVQPSTLRGG